MKHPILEHKGYKLYMILWAAVTVAHFLLLYLYYEITLPAAIADSLVFNLVFSGLGLAFWYVVRYTHLDKKNFAGILINHLMTAALAVSFWVFTSRFILEESFTKNEDYIQFLSNSLLWRALTGLLYYSLIVLVYYLSRYYNDLQDKISHELELKSIVKEAELSMLKSQINPHFVFNSLNSINSLTLSSPEKAREMIIKLSDFLRFSIGKDNKEVNSIEEEIHHIDLYLEIEKVRFGQKLQVEKEIHKKSLKCLIPNMILQPLFENAIKYGVHESLNPKPIKFECNTNTNTLFVNIANHFESDAITKQGEGIGLKNIQKRLGLIYGRHDLITVDKTNKFFKISLKIPQ